MFDAITAPFKKAIDWVKNHFKLPKINLPFGLGKSAPAMAAAPAVAGYGGVGRSSTRATSGGIVINFNGPVGDPHAVARQLRRVLRDDESRLGRLRPAVGGGVR